MNSHAHSFTTGRRPAPIMQPRLHSAAVSRSQSLSSDSSASSQVTMVSLARPPSNASNPNPAATTAASALTRAHLPPRTSSREVSFRQPSPAISPHAPLSPTMSQPPDYHRQRARQYSQGFFEPSLRTTSLQSSGSLSSSLTASTIAAQAAMHNQNPQHARRRSQTTQDLPGGAQPATGRRKPSYPTPVQTQQRFNGPTSVTNVQTGSRAGIQSQAASAAATAYPTSLALSPSDQSRPDSPSIEQKPEKEKSRMNIFSKGKSLHITKDRDGHRMMGGLSPTKMGVYGSSTQGRNFSHSTTSLADGNLSSGSSLYSSANLSSSTLVLPEKEKHRHNFLSRQKHKLGTDHFHLPLSSASSNSRPADPNAPQSLYSFAPPSPDPTTTLNKSISGLDLRHGGRALREKKREGGAAVDGVFRDRDNFGSEFPAMSTLGAINVFGPPSATGAMTPDVQSFGSFGLPNMAPVDAWPFLKARILVIFEGEGEVPRTPVEDFNRLVLVHLQLCIQRRAPSVIIEDLRELLQAGFSSLDQTLRRIPDDRLVPQLVDIWSTVFGTILPFLQAVFLPLDLEFKGRGAIMSPREAADFWGALPIFSKHNANRTPRSATGFPNISMPPPRAPVSQISLGEALGVRTLVLLAFRDTVVLPRHDILLTIFSRLSLDSINGYSTTSDRLISPSKRPGTAASSGSGGNSDFHSASYNSQSSHLLDSSTLSSLGARSRATSNTSAGSFQSVSAQRPQANIHHSIRGHTPQAQPIDSAKVTQTAARMLQCVSVLAGLQTPEDSVWSSNATVRGGHVTAPIAEETNGDEDDAETEARKKMERLAKELKLNWLGRGRTGRQRRGFVGSKVRPVVGLGIGVGA